MSKYNHYWKEKCDVRVTEELEILVCTTLEVPNEKFPRTILPYIVYTVTESKESRDVNRS